MITKDVTKEKLADLEKEYVDFLVKHFGEWEKWAGASQKMLDGEKKMGRGFPENVGWRESG